MGQLSGAIGRLKELREDLSSPTVFYAEHYEGWHALAVATVRQALANLRPLEVEQELWARQIDLAAARVAVDLLGEDEAGAIISLGANSAKDPSFTMAAGGTLTLDQVERWVAAGRSGEDGGKRIDERDAALNDEKIARNVLYAMKLGKPGADGLRAAIAEYIGGEIADEAARLYPEILKVWTGVFSVRCAADWKAWVKERVKAV